MTAAALTIDELISEATRRSAALVLDPGAEPGELAHLVPALEQHLRALTPLEVSTEVTISVPGWTPSPGPTDIVLGGLPRYDAVAEVKVYKLGWCLWDLAKVASLIYGRIADAGYLIVAATSKKFGKPSEFGAVLHGGVELEMDDLFWTYSRDWLDLLRGGSGRPVRLPARAATELLVQEPMPHAPRWEVRAIKVVVPTDPGEVRFASESWPVGHPRLAEPKSHLNLPQYLKPSH